MGNVLARHVILCIIYSSVSIASICTIYQLLYHLFLCCNSCQTRNQNANKTEESKASNTANSATKPKNSRAQKKLASLHNVPSKSQTPSPSKTNETNISISNFFKYSTTICVIMFAVVCFVVNLHPFLLLTNPKYDRKHVTSLLIVGMSWSIWFIGRMVLSLIFIGRLYYTFNSSIYEYTKRTMILYIFCWCLMPLFAILSMLLYFVAPGIAVIICGTIFVLIDIILSISLLYSYLKKLFELICAANDEMLLVLMTKYTLIYTISFTTTFIVFAVLILSPIIGLGMRNQEIIWIFLLTDCLTNIYCLWLKFHFAQKYYNNCCKSLDNKCKLLCQFCAKTQNKVLTKNEEMIVEIQSEYQNTKITAIIK